MKSWCNLWAWRSIPEKVKIQDPWDKVNTSDRRKGGNASTHYKSVSAAFSPSSYKTHDEDRQREAKHLQIWSNSYTRRSHNWWGNAFHMCILMQIPLVISWCSSSTIMLNPSHISLVETWTDYMIKSNIVFKCCVISPGYFELHLLTDTLHPDTTIYIFTLDSFFFLPQKVNKATPRGKWLDFCALQPSHSEPEIDTQ